MSSSQLLALMPILISSAAALVVMVLTAIRRNHVLIFTVTVVLLAASLASVVVAAAVIPRDVTTLLVIDRYGLFYIGLILAATLVLVFLSYGYLKRQSQRREEYYILLILAAVGSEVLACASNYVSFFLGLEILSISLYGLVAYERDTLNGIEAGLKYLILAGVSSAFILFGLALIYAEQGSLQFASILATRGSSFGILSLVGFGLVTVGVGFKLAVVPFHLWTPDVYQGAPAPATAFVATVSKGAIIAFLLRYFIQLNLYQYPAIMITFSLIAGASIIVGNILGLLQNNVKRILAYSSIAHLGYFLVALLASGAAAVSSVTFYLVAYFITNLGAFGVVAYLSESGEQEAEMIEDYRGLAWRHPWIAGVFTAMLLSLASIPLTAGFVGKVFIMTAAAGARLWALLIVLVIGSVISIFYYFRILIAMFRKDEGVTAPSYPSFSLLGGIALSVLTIALVWFGIYPTTIVNVIGGITSSLL